MKPALFKLQNMDKKVDHDFLWKRYQIRDMI